MKRVYVNEQWCLGCHLCEYYCAFAHSGEKDMFKAFNRTKKPPTAITIEEHDDICFSVSCRHCDEPLCVKGCISGALSVNDQGIVLIDKDRCVGCYTCVLSCPYGCIVIDEEKAVNKCDLCVKNGAEPQCVINCPNKAIVFEERE